MSATTTRSQSQTLAYTRDVIVARRTSPEPNRHLCEESGDKFGGVGESLARYAAKVASAIAAQG